MNEAYPGWERTKSFTRGILTKKYGSSDLNFNETTNVIIEIGEVYGRWQQDECMDLKKDLMKLEDAKDGCVPFSNFYKPMLQKGKWQFSENPEYLQELGAVDNSDKSNPKVMIPNYITGASNCVATSSYYSVCCLNECESILGLIERHFQAPDASP